MYKLVGKGGKEGYWRQVEAVFAHLEAEDSYLVLVRVPRRDRPDECHNVSREELDRFIQSLDQADAGIPVQVTLAFPEDQDFTGLPSNRVDGPTDLNTAGGDS